MIIIIYLEYLCQQVDTLFIYLFSYFIKQEHNQMKKKTVVLNNIHYN